MALYIYRGLSRDGKKTKGKIDAGSVNEARALLVRQGMFPIKVIPSEGSESTLKRIFQGKVTAKDKIIFTKQLAVLLKSGVPLLQAMELLVDQFEGRLKTILINVKDGLKQGESLANGLATYKNVFGNIYIQLVRAGEATGNLEVILERLVIYMERRLETTKKIKSAIRMPLIQFVIVMVITVLMLIFVVPKMAQTFQRQGVELPWLTKMVLGISEAVRHYYIIIAVLLTLFIIAFIAFKRTKRGGIIIDTIMLHIPLFGFFVRYGAIVQFSTTLGMLLEGGVNLSESLDIVCSIVSNKVLATALQAARDKIIKEGKITQYLKQTNMFPPVAIYLIKTGEESGQLDKMLLTLGENYDMELSDYADGLTARLQPIVFIFMATIVGTIIMAMATPIFKMAESFGNM